MKIHEILTEEIVQSSWIDELNYDEDSGGTTMVTKSGGEYFFPMSRETYEEWLEYWSKGRFYHYFLKS